MSTDFILQIYGVRKVLRYDLSFVYEIIFCEFKTFQLYFKSVKEESDRLSR